MSAPEVVEDLFSPVVFFFRVAAISSSFIAVVLLLIIFKKKVHLFEDRAWLVFFSVALYSFILLLASSFLFLSLTEEQIEQSFLEALSELPDELTFEEFKILNFLQSIMLGFLFFLENAGSAFIGLVLTQLFFYIVGKK